MTFLPRNLTKEIKKWLDRREIIALKGPRQSGKTTLLEILKNYLIKERAVPANRIVYLTFEDRDILEAFSKNPKEFVKSYIQSYKDTRFYFLIDEFQYLKEEGGQKLKLLYDLYENVKFIITGSSSLELTGHTAKYLVGRVFSFNLFQFSFDEFLETKEDNILYHLRERSKQVLDFLQRGTSFEITPDPFSGELERYFEEYVLFGGYPEVIKTDSMETKQIILKNIYDTYITKDIVELLQIEDVSTFRFLISILSNQIGSLINYHNLALDIKSYYRQIKKNLSILEETFIIRILRPYFTNITTELKKNPKIYFVDTGLRNYITNSFNLLQTRADTGRLVENFVLSHLWQDFSESIKYWRTLGKAEVDFIIKGEDNKIVPVEVKYTQLKEPKLSRSLRNFISQYNPERVIIFNRNFLSDAKLGKTKILFAPVWYAG